MLDLPARASVDFDFVWFSSPFDDVIFGFAFFLPAFFPCFFSFLLFSCTVSDNSNEEIHSKAINCHHHLYFIP